jgi:hypothetical protein
VADGTSGVRRGDGTAGDVQRWEPGTFRTPVRGHAFAVAPEGVERSGSGSSLRLRREPDNPADRLAVAVWVTDGPGATWRFGYLDRAVAARIAPRLDGGATVEVQLDGWIAEPAMRWERPLVRLIERSADVAKPASRAAEDPVPARPSALPPDRARLHGRPPGVRRRTVPHSGRRTVA